MSALSQPIHEVELRRDALVTPMPDGTRLVADLYLPRGAGPWPALLERIPYDKEDSRELSVDAPRFFASRGYAVVIQDTRGRFKSEGEFYPFRDDGWGPNRDGYHTIEWIAAQPWCDGKVGTFGGSYSATTQYAVAPTNPPHLVCGFAREAPCDFHAEWVFRGGAFELGFNTRWILLVTSTNLEHLVRPDEVERRRRVIEAARAELPAWWRHLPINPNPLVAGLSDWYHDWLDHPEDGPYWWQWNVGRHHHEIDVPLYHLGGWFDGFLQGTIDNFVGITRHGRSERARRNQKLIIGPWVHGPTSTAQTRTGELDSGPAAAAGYNEIRLPWFDYWLKGIDSGVMDEPPVRFFTMGANEWQTASTWPPLETRPVDYYFATGPSGSATSLNDGRLRPVTPDPTEQPDSYRYDPREPVPALGGGWLASPSGAYDQRPVEPRVLTYTSEPLSEDLEVTGRVTATIYAMSSAPDTDWVVRLSDVAPDGLSRLVADGILRARYRDSRQHQSLLEPHRVYPFTVDLWSTSNRFRAGHRIRVAVTSSCFPRWDANPNTGGPFGREARGQVALNTVFHDALRPSRITLPVRRPDGGDR